MCGGHEGQGSRLLSLSSSLSHSTVSYTVMFEEKDTHSWVSGHHTYTHTHTHSHTHTHTHTPHTPHTHTQAVVPSQLTPTQPLCEGMWAVVMCVCGVGLAI